MMPARSAIVIVRRHDFGAPAAGRDELDQRARAPRPGSPGRAAGRRPGSRPARPAAEATDRLAPEEAPSRSSATAGGARRHRDRRGRAAAGRAARPPGRPPRRRPDPQSAPASRRGSIARLLIRISWPATATNADTLPIRSASSVGQGLEVGAGERAERDGQDVELAAPRSGPAAAPAGRRSRSSRTWVAVSGVPAAVMTTDGEPSRGPPSAGAAMGPRPSVRLVGEEQQLARPRIGRVLLVADQLDGPAAQPAAAASSADRSAWSRSWSRAGRKPGKRRVEAGIHAPERLAERPGDPRP